MGKLIDEEIKEKLDKHELWLQGKADGERANLLEANLEGASLRGVNLRGAYLRWANLGGSNFEGASLRGANLERANLCGANLCGADLKGANLQGADLRGADLRRAYLRGANLYGVNLSGANLMIANLSGADLGKAKGVVSFTGGKHLAVAYKWNNDVYIKIACRTKLLSDWRKEFEAIGADHCYTEEEIYTYGLFIALVENDKTLNKPKETM